MQSNREKLRKLLQKAFWNEDLFILEVKIAPDIDIMKRDAECEMFTLYKSSSIDGDRFCENFWDIEKALDYLQEKGYLK